MKKSHIFTCILCPLGCRIELVEEKNKILEIKGNECKKGEKYAADEFANPLRILTTTIKIQGGIISRLPVRSAKLIPKKLIIPCIKELAKVKVKAPIRYGEVIFRNIFNLGVDIISSRNLERDEVKNG